MKLDPSTQLQIENIGDVVGSILDYFFYVILICICLVGLAILTGAV